MTVRPGLRSDAEFVIKAVARGLSGSWIPGENRADAYLTLGADTIPVEISTLTQRVTDDCGTRSRLSDDLATVSWAKAEDKGTIEACLAHAVCAGRQTLDEARWRIWSDWRAAAEACE
jgi:hypothetical protein